MNLRVAKDGRVLVVSVIENGAADRASDPSGNSCPVKSKDEIAEINGVSLTVRPAHWSSEGNSQLFADCLLTLQNMTNEDILTIVQELPLYVLLTIKRTNPRRRSRANEEDEYLEEEEENEEEENDEDAKPVAIVSPIEAKKTETNLKATLNDDANNNEEESCTSLSGHASPNTVSWAIKLENTPVSEILTNLYFRYRTDTTFTRFTCRALNPNASCQMT